ncbi:MAG: sulfatase-like hydrolase/transferase, partial [Pseudomonadales bacterium]
IVGCAGLVLTLTACRGADSERGGGAPPPNIVLIVADDLGWNDLSFNGGGIAGGTVPTPHINGLAAQGVNFVNGYAGQGTCAPSRAMLMTGRYGSRFGFEYTPMPAGMDTAVKMMTEGLNPPAYWPEVSRDIRYEEKGLPAEEESLAEVLKRAGYYTAHIGKWHLGRENGSAPQDQGFDQSLLMASGLHGDPEDPNIVNAKLDYDPIDRFLWAGMKYAARYNGGPAFRPGGYLTEYYTDEAVKVIENNRDRPFFLYLAHWAPHTPLQALRKDYDALGHIADHTERVYAAMIRGLDREVGRVLGALEAEGLADNTVVIFTSDNGGAGYVGLDDLNKPYRGWKITNFEGGIHVPFFVRWPSGLPQGTTFEAPVHHFDIFATVAEAAGAALARPIDGVSLLPFARGTRAAERPHETLFWRAGAYRTVRHGDWKLAVDPVGEQTWLFDLARDPGERLNVAANHPEVVADLKTRLAAHDAEMVPPLWDSGMVTPTNVDKHHRQARSPEDTYVYWHN